MSNSSQRPLAYREVEEFYATAAAEDRKGEWVCGVYVIKRDASSQFLIITRSDNKPVPEPLHCRWTDLRTARDAIGKLSLQVL